MKTKLHRVISLLLCMVMLTCAVPACAQTQSVMDEELSQAFESGFAPDFWADQLDTPMAINDFCALMMKVIAPIDDTLLPAWETLAAGALTSTREMKREDAMIAVYEAACLLGQGQNTNGDWGATDVLLESGDYFWELSWEYPEWSNLDDDAPFCTNCDKIPGGAYHFAQGQVSPVSGKRVFDLDEENKDLHMLDPLTKGEALVILQRFGESLIQPKQNSETEINATSSLDALHEWQREELEQAVEAGFATPELAAQYDRPVTEKEFLAMLAKSKELLQMGDEINPPEQDSNTITRKQAAGWIQDMFNNNLFQTPCGFATRYREDADTREQAAIIDAGGSIYDNEPFYGYMLMYRDLSTNYSIMDMTEDYRFRPEDTMTVLEAIQAAYRLSNSLMPADDYVEFSKVDHYVMDESLPEQAALMPEVTADSFSFRGINTFNKENGEATTLSLMYSDNQAKVIRELGFNFTRIPIAYSLILSEDGTQINQIHLKNLDGYIEACIRNHLHACIDLHYYPSDGHYNVDAMTSFWTLLTKRYQEIPSTALSFNVINEPSGGNELVNTLNLTLVECIHAVDPQRLVFCDGLEGHGGVSKLPSQALASQKNVVQSLHWYQGAFNGDYTLGQGGYAPADLWPFPYVDAHMDEEDQITLSGDFQAGEKITVRTEFHSGENASLRFVEDGECIANKTFGEGKTFPTSESLRAYEVELPKDGKTIEIQTDAFILVANIEILHNEPSTRYDQYNNPNEYNTYTGKGTDKLVTNIMCMITETEGFDQEILLSNDGTYSVKATGNQPLWVTDYGAEGFKDYLTEWIDYSNLTGQKFMVQEFGVYCSNAAYRVRLNYMKDLICVLADNQIGWNSWDGQSILRGNQMPYQLETSWINVEGFWLDKQLVDFYKNELTE